ncbi:hypothetical protein BGZ76_009522 [Entomortierella beljakovae]|nr:hypothetical protein BGZ76_009522 [Entomortierella beljakovae]
MESIPQPSYRTQRAHSLAPDICRDRQTFQTYGAYSKEFDSRYNEFYERPLPPLPSNFSKTLESMKMKDLPFITSDADNEERQAKLERKQKKDEYKQMYQKQFEYQQTLETNKVKKRPQLSLPIYTDSFPSPQSSRTTSTLSEPRTAYASAPLDDIAQYTTKLQHRRSRQLQRSDTTAQHLDSLSSVDKPSKKNKVTDDMTRSLSLMSQSVKSLHDLRPWPNQQSPTLEYRMGYESDETSMSRGWDSLMDTLTSPTIPSPMHSPSLESSFKEDAVDLDRVNSGMEHLSLNLESRINGNGKYLLILGANGRTGIELVKQGLDRNYRVTAFVRDDKVLLEDSTLRKNQNLLIVHGSPTNQADMDRCVEGQDVVVNVIGARIMSNDTTISSHSQVVLNNAMKKHGVKRLIVVTSYGCLGLRNYLISTKKLFSRIFMTGILKDKVLQEEVIQRESSSLNWTIVRPITLKDGGLTGKYWLSSDQLPSSSKVKVLTRADLAHYILSIMNAPEEHHMIRSIAGKSKGNKLKPKPKCAF